jgi:hypothetical protein
VTFENVLKSHYYWKDTSYPAREKGMTIDTLEFWKKGRQNKGFPDEKLSDLEYFV